MKTQKTTKKSGKKLSASKMAEIKGGASPLNQFPTKINIKDLLAGPNDKTVVDRPSLTDLVSIRNTLAQRLR